MNKKTRLMILLVLLSPLLLVHLACATDVDKAGFILTNTQWWVEDIAGQGVIDVSHTTVHFLDDGLVAGDTGCNRYRGSAEVSANNISFGPIASTRKACASALMDQEMKFSQALARVASWEVPASGLLHLKDAEGLTVIRASRVEE